MISSRLRSLAAVATLVLGATACKHAQSSATAAVETSGAGQEIAPKEEPPVVPVAAEAPGLPKHVDAKDLDVSEKKVLAEILAEQFDPCGKSRSFAQSLDAGDCPLAIKLAASLVGYLQQGQGKKQVVAMLLKDIERLNTVVEIQTQGAPRLGPVDAKATVIEFSDFECPFCRRAAGPLIKLQKHYNFALYYKFFPLKVVHPNAEGAARAGWAAMQQGKFWELAEAMFAAEALDWPAVQKLAGKLGLDMKKFLEDFNSPKSKEFVDADVKAGDGAGVDGTPTFYVNGHKAESLSQVQDLVRDQLQGAGAAVPAPMTAEIFGEATPPAGHGAQAAGAPAAATPTSAPAVPGAAPTSPGTAPSAVPAK
jgi:protein-disulfide isomerase